MMGPDDIAALLASMQNEPETTPAPETDSARHLVRWESASRTSPTRSVAEMPVR